MAERQEIVARVKTVREQHLKLSQKELALTIGVSPGLIGQIEMGKIGVSARVLNALSARYSVNPAWILEGREPVLFDRPAGFSGRQIVVDPPDSARPGYGDLSIGGQDYALVRRMGLSVSAGNGLEPLPEGDEDGLIFPMAWLTRRGIDPGLSVIVGVRGDSMAPAIPDGALVLIDCRVRRFEGPGVYAFSWQGQAYVKRVLPSGKGKDGKPAALVLLSDNPAYGPVTLTGPDMNAPSVAGKVRATLNILDD